MKDRNNVVLNINDDVEFIFGRSGFDMCVGKVVRFTPAMVVVRYNEKEYRRDPFNVRKV